MIRIRFQRALVLLTAAAAALQGCSGSSRSSASGPTLGTFAPATGTIGTKITISGSAFSGTTAAPPSVTFVPSSGGATYAAQVTAVSATSIDVVVPTVPTALAAPGTAFDVTVANPGGGSTTSAHAFAMAAPTTTDVNGGLAGSGSPGSSFIVDGDSFGDLSAAAAGYSLDFRDATTGDVVASSSVQFTSGDWTNIYIVGVVPNGLAAGASYQLTVTTPSGTSTPRVFEVLAAVPFSPSAIQWSATSSLPVAQQGFPAVVAAIGTESYLYALGGNVATTSTSNGKASNVATVYLNRFDPTTGGLANASWASTTPLPAERGFAAAVVADAFNSVVPGNGALYVLGGLDATGAATSTVYYALPNVDGTIPAAGAAGTWATTTPLPQPLFAHGAVLFHGRIYVAGGNDAAGAPVASVYSAKIGANGTLGAWQTLTEMPSPVAYHQLVTAAGTLYVLGGDAGAVDPVTNAAGPLHQAGIEYDPIDIRNGMLTGASWTTNLAQLNKAREKFTAVVAGAYVLVSGGLYDGNTPNPSSEESYMAIAADGTMDAPQGATGVNTVYTVSGGDNFYNHAAAYYVDASGAPHVLVLGGGDANTGGVHAQVFYQH